MYLGIEIGGTKLQLGLGAGEGKIVSLWRGSVDPRTGGDGIRRQISNAAAELLGQAGLARSQIQGVGVGFGGPVDDVTERVVKSHQIEGWDDFPLAEWLGDLLDLPVALGNDCDCAGLAEALFGAGKGLSPIFYITIGSGIGGGLIIDGEIYRGCGRGAAEIGHLRVAQLARGELQYRIIERLASGWGIEAQAKLMGNRELISAGHVARAAASGDPLAARILDAAWDSLAEGICHIIALLCPRRIVIGGGVSLMGEELLFAPLRRKVAARVFAPFADCCDITPAALGEEVVVHGALALARKRSCFF